MASRRCAEHSIVSRVFAVSALPPGFASATVVTFGVALTMYDLASCSFRYHGALRFRVLPLGNRPLWPLASPLLVGAQIAPSKVN